MKQLTGNQVRQMFLDYFQSKDHMIEPGVSLVPHNDPTLLWINAGILCTVCIIFSSPTLIVAILSNLGYTNCIHFLIFVCRKLVSA